MFFGSHDWAAAELWRHFVSDFRACLLRLCQVDLGYARCFVDVL